MQGYYFVKVRKNKKYAPQAKAFEGSIDKGVRDLILVELFNNVFRKYCKL
jgi:hypothetical protein